MNLEIVLKCFLPKEMLEYFDLVKIERITEDVLLLHLVEKPIKPIGHTEKQLVSKGFDEPVRIQDFPIRYKADYLRVRRCKWIDKTTGKVYATNWNLTANGISYTKKVVSFFKNFLNNYYINLSSI